MRNTTHLIRTVCVFAVGCAQLGAQFEYGPGEVPYVPTPPEVVEAMLQLGAAKKTDIVYDLGCGDGRIVITAAKKYGARGKGIDIDPKRIAEATENAKKEGVAQLLRFEERNLFDADFREATLVTLYLLPDVNLRLRPKLVRDLKVGSRIVSHSFTMAEWEPTKKQDVNGRTIYLWIVTDEAKQKFAEKAAAAAN